MLRSDAAEFGEHGMIRGTNSRFLGSGTCVKAGAERLAALGPQLAAIDQADGVPPLRRWCGDVEDVGADGGEDVGPETAILPLLQ